MESEYLIREEKIDPNKTGSMKDDKYLGVHDKIGPTLIYKFLTEPVRDERGVIIEPARFLDAAGFENEVAIAWSMLTPEQKVAFYLEIDRVAALNREPELTSGMHKQ